MKKTIPQSKTEGTVPTEPLLISYIRVSTPEQAEGYSEARQTKRAEDWAKAKGLNAEDWAKSKGLNLRRYADRGVSGYSGANRKKGALSILLKEIEAGKIPKGSILAVENLDRLSREHPFNSFDLIKTILKKGILNLI